MTRTAISPRLAIKIFFSTDANVGGVDPEHVIPEDAASGNSSIGASSDDEGGEGWASVDWPVGWSVRHVAETGSTNVDLLAALEAGRAGDRTVLATSHQTAGRGRLDRRWDAPIGTNLLTSFLFARESVPTRGDDFPFMALVSIAAIDAIERLAATTFAGRLGLKWPNDLLLDEQKLAGVLAQRSPTGGTVVGIGLNVSWAPPGAGCVHRDLGLIVSPAALLNEMLSSIDGLLGRADSRAQVSERYRERLLTLGQEVRIELPGDRTVTGTAVDVDADGRLLVETGDTTATFDVGDVVHARRA